MLVKNAAGQVQYLSGAFHADKEGYPLNAAGNRMEVITPADAKAITGLDLFDRMVMPTPKPRTPPGRQEDPPGQVRNEERGIGNAINARA